MINIIPQTELRLLKTPLEKDSEHTMSFANINAQISYFLARTFKVYTDFTYQRENQSVVVAEPYDTICTCNYLMYKNNGFTNKYFYAFITKMEYVNENATRIYFEIDSLQTWYFNIVYNKSFIEREHANTDNIGDNVLPENLETGEYINVKAKSKFFDDPDDYYMCMAVASVLQGVTEPTVKLYTGVYGGLYYLIFNTFTDIENCIKMYAKQGIVESINSLFVVPKNLPSIINGSSQSWTYDGISCNVIFPSAYGYADYLGEITLSMETQLDNHYVPKNKKLYTYPYNYMMITNNSGTEVIYRYEDFSNVSSIKFDVEASITPGMSIKATPKNYKKEFNNYIEGITFGKLPICSWQSDTYTNWLTQNSLNNTIQFGASAVGSLLSVPSMNAQGIVSGVQGMSEALHQKTVASMTPYQAKGNTNNGDINFTSYNSGITVYYYGIKEQYLKIIDEYFSKYGYATNRVKTPNITGRRNWNYVKTIDCNFTGDIPQEDLEKIKAIFNKGITFWHNSNNFLNYSVNNDII